MADYGGLWQTMADYGGLWRTMADYGGPWQTMADYGGLWRTIAGEQSVIFVTSEPWCRSVGTQSRARQPPVAQPPSRAQHKQSTPSKTKQLGSSGSAAWCGSMISCSKALDDDSKAVSVVAYSLL